MQAETKSFKVIRKSNELQSYHNKTQNKEMVYFNLVTLEGSEFYHPRVYQKHKFNTIKEGMSFKFSNIIKKDNNVFWATSASIIAYTSAVEVDSEVEKNAPPLPEQRPAGGLEVDLQTALKSPEKSTVRGKIVMVIFSQPLIVI